MIMINEKRDSAHRYRHLATMKVIAEEFDTSVDCFPNEAAREGRCMAFNLSKVCSPLVLVQGITPEEMREM